VVEAPLLLQINVDSLWPPAQVPAADRGDVATTPPWAAGVVSFFADFTHEGSGSIDGPCLAHSAPEQI